MKGETHQCGLMLGGNMPGTLTAFADARRSIDVHYGKIISQSAIYKSEPWGMHSQADYFNQALLISTFLPPLQLLHALQQTEVRLGRITGRLNSPRVIDIDILFYDNLVLETELLVIPHPRMHTRNFNLVPLMEILPDWIHPVLRKPIAGLVKSSPDPLKVTRYE